MMYFKTEDEIKNEIKYLCNFYEKQHSGTVATISYMDFIEEDTFQEQLKAKSQNRELAIDIMTGEKEESSWDNRVDLPIIDSNYVQTIGPKIFSMTVQGKPFTCYEDLHTDILKYIESTIGGINLLSLQDNKIIIDKVLEILITLYDFRSVINAEFYVSIYKNITNINDEILTVFQSNIEAQNDVTYQSINNIFNMYEQYIKENDLIKEQITNIINNSKTTYKEDYEQVMVKQQFDFGELNPSHKFSAELNSKIDNKSLMRIVSEISSFKSGLPLNWESSIWMRVPKNKMNLFTFIISGPKDTPYENGLFEFHACFPTDYPNKEPKVLLVTTGFGKVRFNPNLYNCGKVCLSLLGTWSGEQGEKWNPKTSTFLQVLISIQSLILVEQPYFNEPGYERDMHTPKGKQRSADYNEVIQLGTMEWAINHQINNPPLGYELITKEHFKRKKDDIIKLCETWISKANKLKEQMTNVFANIKTSLDSLENSNDN